MAPRLVRADERVDAVRGCLAVLRGPIVYCVEQADLPDGVPLEQLRLDPAAAITEERVAGDVTPVRLRLSGAVRPPGGALYEPDSRGGDAGDPVSVTAIPYHAWANRGPGAMRVWLPLR